ncbi:unnamed protein product [Prorocentrum cordatum]|uniref:Ion transport domain-containing protein n=1 Tax=Prorocentrum cordatum TaxID=2364126 RepID=A0ABN9TSA8_9DINO|nr:unnamed protein product [Polarella glacialis]
MAEISRVSATFPDPAPRHSETSRATSVAPLAEFQQALSAALAEAFAGLRRAQDILDGDLSDQLDAALWVRRGTAASILKPQPPTLPGAVPPGCPSVLNQDSPDPLPKDAAAAALRAAAREAHRATAVEILEQPPPARPAPRLQLKDVPEALHGGRGRSVRVASPLKLSPADSRSSSWSARPPAGPAEVEPATRDHPPWEHRRNRRTTRTMSHSRVFNFDSEKDVIAHWTRIVTALEELHVSGMSMLHSSWKDAKEFTIFVANPALEAIRGDADASAVGTDFHLNGKDFKQDRPTMIWQALCYIFLLVLHPFTKYRMLWDFVGMTICFHDVTMLPAQVFVLPESYLEVRSYYEGICAAFWTIDILLNFSTGFISSEGLLEMRKEAVAQNYIRSWFFPDLVITVFDWISLIIPALAALASSASARRPPGASGRCGFCGCPSSTPRSTRSWEQ